MFSFKRFSIADDMSTIKVGTDAVLLGSWAWLPEHGDILDVGCGCGVISLMIAQRAPEARILGIDIHKPSVLQARNNAENSPFDNVQFRTADFRAADLNTSFSAIISNPPYHTETLHAPSAHRAAARSEAYLPFIDLIRRSYELLTEGGHLEVILPAQAKDAFHELCSNIGFTLSRSTYVRTTLKKVPKRVLLDFTKGSCTTEAPTEIILLDEAGLRSKTYSQLCQDFYL